MVRRHFLLRSSVTPTLKVERGPGNDSPAELFSEPCGTASAGSDRPSFCMGEAATVLSPRISGELAIGKCNDCLALLIMSRARATPLLLRFFSPVGLVSSVERLPGGLFESETGRSGSVTSVSGFDSVGSLSKPDSWSLGEPEEPNILLRSPPVLEKLLRLFPASLSGGMDGDLVAPKGPCVVVQKRWRRDWCRKRIGNCCTCQRWMMRQD